MQRRLLPIAWLAMTTAALLLGPLLSNGAASSDDWQPSVANLTGYDTTVTWTDEFDVAGSPDATSWKGEVQAWPFNGELQYYTDDSAHTSVKNDTLQITATNTANGGREYTSARWSTQGRRSFGPGLFAARIRLPQGQGMWPSFRLYGTGSRYLEIDVLEMAGGDSAAESTGSGDDSSFKSVAWFQTDVGGSIFRPFSPLSHTSTAVKLADAFHVFWVEWTAARITIGFDDQSQVLGDVSQIAAFSNASVYLVFDLAIGGGWTGTPDSTTVFPQTMQVDWVRVWASADAEENNSSSTTEASSSTGVTDTVSPVVPVLTDSPATSTPVAVESTPDSTPTASAAVLRLDAISATRALTLLLALRVASMIAS